MNYIYAPVTQTSLSVFEGMMLFSDVCVPQYLAVIGQEPGKLGISCFGKASLGNVLLHRCAGEQAGLGHVLIRMATGALHITNLSSQASQNSSLSIKAVNGLFN